MRTGTTALLSAAILGLGAQAVAQEVKPPPPNANFVAVVVGVSQYEKLPNAITLDFARSDAATVHKALKEQGKFSHTFLLRDREATKEGLENLLRTEVAQVVGPNDVFVLYFVGHGVGADLDLPTLLTYDSTLENGQEDGLELQNFTANLQTWAKAGTTLIVTDAIHRNQLDGVYFFGPAANQWPQLPDGTMILSSSEPESPSKDGVFGAVFADAMSGAADANADRYVTASELVSYVEQRLAPAGQIPVAAGSFDPNMVLARDVAGTAGPATSAAAAVAVDYGDADVYSAKFVFREGGSQTVQCREQPVEVCSPSCYVRDFKAGPCELNAIIDGEPMSGKVIVLFPGKYDCGLRAGRLSCKPPLEAAKK